MAQLYNILKPENTYYDRRTFNNLEDYMGALQTSTTVYVGNLSFYTSQDSIRQLFSLAGRVKDIIMGIDNEGHPCGFCFVIYQSRQEAGYAVQYVSKTKLNSRTIRVDWDHGYKKGREKGRGLGGQQRRDDFRNKEDAQRPKKKPAFERDRYDRSDRHDRHDRHERSDRNERNERPERERTRERQDYGDRENRDRDYKRKDRDHKEGEQRHRPKETRKQQDEGY